MAKINVYAKACTFKAGNGYRSMMYMPFDPSLDLETIETSKVAEIEAKKQELADRLKAADPSRSFFVSAIILRGTGRKPNGFDAMQTLEYDAEIEQAKAAA